MGESPGTFGAEGRRAPASVRTCDVSIVIPTLGDDAPLARLLSDIRAWPRPPREIIVADGAASATAQAECARHAALWLACAPGRGLQLAHGAARASGSVLWFVHADARPHPESLAAIVAAICAGAAGGCFRFRFDGQPTWIKPLIERCVAWRSRYGVPYGDQGLFATRAAFDACGGFAPAPLFEEVPLVRGLRRYGRFELLALPILVSDRRWQRDGWLRRTLNNRLLAAGYALGLSPALLARWYGPGHEGDAPARRPPSAQSR
jgi:rSAM/selenodomain-associated transferase 2